MSRRQESRRARKNSKEQVRLALSRGLVRSLVANGAVETTEVRAKTVAPFVDSLVSRARFGTDQAQRMISARLGQDKEAVKGLFAMAGQVGARTSGFTRIIKLGIRVGDSAPMARLEWVDKVEVKEKIKDKNEKPESKAKKAKKK